VTGRRLSPDERVDILLDELIWMRVALRTAHRELFAVRAELFDLRSARGIVVAPDEPPPDDVPTPAEPTRRRLFPTWPGGVLRR
jgi:hypothetical protein